MSPAALSAQSLTLSTLAGQAGQRGSADGTGATARFANPTGLALDSEGNVYVADTGNHTIRRITANGIVTTVAGTAGQSGSADGLGPLARFNSPTAVAVDGTGNIYVADTGNALVRQITPAGLVVTLPLAGLLAPAAICLDAAGNGYVADRVLNVIGTTTPTGVQNVLAGSPGRRGSTDGAGSTARFNAPSGLSVTARGVVYVLDNDNYTVRRVGADGQVTTLAGTALQGGYSDGAGSAARFLFRQTTGITTDATGDIFLADDGNHVIRRVTAAGVVSTVAGFGGASGSADGTAQAARLNSPAGIAIDRSGNLYIADTGNHTLRLGRPAAIAPYPAIAGQPLSISVNSGSRVVLSVLAAGSAPLAYQWRKEGVSIAGATDAQLNLASSTATDAGIYSVTASNSAGVTTSNDARLTIGTGGSSRIGNLSVRTNLPANQALTVGFATSGPRNVIVRALGPALASFGLTGAHPDPLITLYDGAGIRADGNDSWEAGLSTAFASVGAFPLPTGSKDAALQRLVTGTNTAQISGPGAGIVLVETYDAGGAATSRLANVSCRTSVGVGENVLIAGLFIEGNVARTLLFRGIGPQLADFGVANTLADPKLEIFDASGRKIAENDNWSASLAPLFAPTGAFALTSGSRDSALLISLPAGQGYTVQLSGANGGTGEALVEVYDFP